MAIKAAWDTLHIVLSGLLILCIKEHTDSEDVTVNCPETCLCYTPALGDGLLINCSHRGLEQIPHIFPVDTKEIHLDHNAIQVLETIPCDSMPKVSKIYLNSNEIRHVMESAFVQCKSGYLEMVDLSQNNLTDFPVGLPQSLKTLKMGYNAISKIDSKHFMHLQELQELSLTSNLIKFLTKASFHTTEGRGLLPDLKRLAIDNNEITLIEEKSFAKLSSLRHMSLAGNKLETMKNKTFSGLHMLQTLDLRNNNLHTLGSKTFLVLHSLEYLYLSHNNLTEIPKGLPMLEWLDLSYNNITHVKEDSAKSILYPVEVFLISHNPLHCDCKMLWLKELFDTREYLVKFLDGVSPSDFYPTCQSPAELEGESWEVIGDEVFSCSTRVRPESALGQDEEGEGKDVSEGQPVTEIKRSISSLDVTFLKMNAEQDGPVDIEWTCPSCADSEIVGYEILYYPVGHRLSRECIQVSSETHEFSIKGLVPGTVYFVCILPKLTWEEKVKVSLDQCVEVVTAGKSIWSTLLTWDSLYVLVYTAVIAGGVLLALTALSGLVIGASVWSLNRRSLGGNFGK